jgi:hypothetical protein
VYERFLNSDGGMVVVCLLGDRKRGKEKKWRGESGGINSSHHHHKYILAASPLPNDRIPKHSLVPETQTVGYNPWAIISHPIPHNQGRL